MADVRISTHTARTQNHKFAMVRFYDGLENLIGTDYVILSVEDNRLLFKPSEVKVKGSLKLSHLVNVWKQFDMIEPFEGEYSLEYDSENGIYFVDKDRKSAISRVYGNHNVPHFNYKSHVNAPYVQEDVVEIETAPVDGRKYSMVIYDGLLELLRAQILKLNKADAKLTLETIKMLLSDE